jgi:hypothetical protein
VIPAHGNERWDSAEVRQELSSCWAQWKHWVCAPHDADFLVPLTE